MNRLVAGVVVALMLVGTVALMSGCGGSESTPAGGTGVAQPAGGATGGPSAQDRPMSDDQLKVFVQTMPKDQWEQTPFAKQIEAYVAKHPDVKFVGSPASMPEAPK